MDPADKKEILEAIRAATATPAKAELLSTPEPKPGIKSTELYVSGAVVVVGALVALGLIAPNMIDTTQLGADVGTIVEAVVRIVGVFAAAAAAKGYTESRTKIKAASAAKEDMP